MTAPQTGDGEKPPTGLKAVEAAAAGNPSPAAAMNALAYFMGDEPPPGTDDIITEQMDFGRSDGRLVEVKMRSLAIEELDRCAHLAAKSIETNPDLADLGLSFIRWSYVFAYACIDPNLGEALTARRQAAQELSQDPDPVKASEGRDMLKRLTDTASIVREVFRKRGGILQRAVFEVEKKAKLGDHGEGSVSVVEVEAGKASS